MENEDAMGGMRRPDKSVQWLPAAVHVGRRLHSIFSDYLESKPGLLQVVTDIRNGIPTTGFDIADITALQHSWRDTLQAGDIEWQSLPGPRADILESWGRAVGDPDAASILPTWLREGAPMGISADIPTAGVFPEVDVQGDADDPNMLYSILAGWTNYSSADPCL